jgi:YHS domain-containing protein
MNPTAHSTSVRPRGTGRVHFVDVLRLLALAQMVNGHTLHAVLREDVRHGDFYQGYLWFRGLVSVAFMLVAGVAFYITTVARFEQHRRDPAAFQRRVMRALLIVAIGFLLRLPLSALLSLHLRALESGLMSLSRIDVLPCIGVSLLVLECLVRIGKSPRQVVSACLGLCILCALAAPWGASLPSTGATAFVTGWLGPQGGSAFPLLPFSGYVFAGVVLGALALPAAGRTPAHLTALRLAGASLVLFALGWLAARGPGWLAHASSPQVHTPSFFVTKLATVTLAMALLSLCLRNVRGLPGPLRVLAGETLAVYVFHLLVLYGFPINLHGRIGTTLALPLALSLSTLMLAASAAAGLGWHHITRWHPARRFLPSERVALLASSAIVICAMLLVATRAFAEPPVNTNGTDYAIGGYDPVAYFQDKHATKGSPQFQFQHQGATWLFASELHKRTFEASPARYLPRYGGHCAFAAAQGRLVTIDPQAWSIVRDRLYLNYSLAIRDQWNADRERFIRLADARFPTPSASAKKPSGSS